jgi:hypothetical protein
MDYLNKVQRRLCGNAEKLGLEGTKHFCPKTLKNIKKDESWLARLKKRHPFFSRNNEVIYEMQSLNSSDALLMNVFCCPSFIKWQGPKTILNIQNYGNFMLEATKGV